MLLWQGAPSQCSHSRRRSRSTCPFSLSQRWQRTIVLVASIACQDKRKQSHTEMKILALLLLAVGTCAAYVVYGNGATSERNLPLCGGPREACNIIRQRYWLSPLVHRLCKCPDLTDCPAQWSQDKRTVAFNARAQLKFCSQVGELDPCENEGTVAAEIRSNGTISIHCFCGEGHYFQRLSNNATGQYFKCLPLGACRSGDHCGRITANSYETYHICTCPSQHICVLQNRDLEYTNEFLYQGQAYKGHCVPL